MKLLYVYIYINRKELGLDQSIKVDTNNHRFDVPVKHITIQFARY